MKLLLTLALTVTCFAETHRFQPTEFYNTFSGAHAPVLRIKPGDDVVTFTIDATATSVCSISGSTVSFLTVGTCKIDANQAGNANYTAAPQVQQTFSVAKGDQTITFTSTPPPAPDSP